MKFHIYQKDWEDHEYCERQEAGFDELNNLTDSNKGGRYRPVLVSASSKEEALEIFLTERGWEDEGYFYAISDERFKKIMAEKQKLRDMGYSSWDEYYKDLYPSRPIQL